MTWRERLFVGLVGGWAKLLGKLLRVRVDAELQRKPGERHWEANGK